MLGAFCTRTASDTTQYPRRSRSALRILIRHAVGSLFLLLCCSCPPPGLADFDNVLLGVLDAAVQQLFSHRIERALGYTHGAQSRPPAIRVGRPARPVVTPRHPIAIPLVCSLFPAWVGVILFSRPTADVGGRHFYAVALLDSLNY